MIPLRQHLCRTSCPRCHSRESTPHRLHLHCRHCGPPPTDAPQLVRLELPGYQVPLAQSQKAPPPEMRTVVRCAVALAAVAHPEVPTD
jgi:hypothetical protein